MPATPILLLTRPAVQSQRFAQQARAALGPLTVVISPLTEIRFLEAEMPREGAVIFTSENGVLAHARRVLGAGRRAWCVGARTARAAEAAGFHAQTSGGDADALVSDLIARGVRGPLLHVRGTHSRGAVADRLNSAGIETHEAELYDQRPKPPTAEARALLADHVPLLVPLFSPRSAALFAAAATGAGAPLHIFAFSAAVAAALKGVEMASLDVAARPEAGAMIDAMAQRIAAAGLA
ncbi:uroporphyrinogen III synthase [Defluviimonas sp. 20V17]|uniref:Uroporphyrinogen III methyltransferase n=1 Tax=Allgaiera indica TaxID=765699 RepID=A0AAN4ZYK8_9RHOB|nr:uroporphyrinogen-III synthase [Allgaiera indica]KDB03596.1 uroporphyrinogen III synthase [Defluviimonas sp. 20V17]GHD98318.1 uroporphyrinogen III methyltransferase [Allgaiera indica]SDW49590.1 uroporphyrinogen-III synthase [Allgaiera indica]